MKNTTSTTAQGQHWFGAQGEYSVMVYEDCVRAETPHNAKTFAAGERTAVAAVNSDLEMVNAPVRFRMDGEEVESDPTGWWI